jgi:serine protease AprX
VSFHQPRRTSRDAFLTLRLFLAVALCSAGLSLGFFSVNVGGASVPRFSAAAKIAPWVHDHTANGQQAEFLVVLSDQADLTQARSAKSKLERGRQVRDALWRKAQQTQQGILQWLREHKIEYRAFYIVNAIWVKADAETAMALATRADVLRVEGNPEIRNEVEPIPANASPSAPNSTDTVEAGIDYSHAPQVWSLGYTGQGIVVAGADTGYRWTHTALKNQYRGWNGVTANHDYNWHDSIHSGSSSCGTNSTQPCDGYGHGTHTMGTAVGDDGNGNQIGMAPGAKWIGCRNMDDQGVGTPARYMECMEFFLAPYPVGGTSAEGDPSLAPDISTNSWGCPPSEGCSTDTLQAAVEAQRAAGIFMVAAAGNDGAMGCQTITDPPAIYDAVYTVGALNSGTDGIANFSSRGPVTIDNSSRLKPDLCAPGTNVRSAWNTSNTAYATLQGTSMATPHVAGAAALLWSAAPWLRHHIDHTETILNTAAFPIQLGNNCDNATVPNNTYGNGRLDAKVAVDYAFFERGPSSVSTNGSAVTVTFYASANRTYRLEYRNSMTDTDWLPVPGIADFSIANTGNAQMTDPYTGQQPERIYRVRAVQ